jgi:hypothetical protein
MITLLKEALKAQHAHDNVCVFCDVGPGGKMPAGGGGGDFPHPSRPTQPPIQWVLGLLPGGKAAEAWL